MMTMLKTRHIFFTLGLGAPGAVVALSTSRIADLDSTTRRVGSMMLRVNMYDMYAQCGYGQLAQRSIFLFVSLFDQTRPALPPPSFLEASCLSARERARKLDAARATKTSWAARMSFCCFVPGQTIVPSTAFTQVSETRWVVELTAETPINELVAFLMARVRVRVRVTNTLTLTLTLTRSPSSRNHWPRTRRSAATWPARPSSRRSGTSLARSPTSCPVSSSRRGARQ